MPLPAFHGANCRCFRITYDPQLNVPRRPFLANRMITFRTIRAPHPGPTRFRQKSRHYANNLAESSRRYLHMVASLYKPGGSSPSKCGSYPVKRRHSKRSASRRTSPGTRLRSTSRKIEKSINSTRDTPMNQRIRSTRPFRDELRLTRNDRNYYSGDVIMRQMTIIALHYTSYVLLA